jgi:hypothetical protein
MPEQQRRDGRAVLDLGTFSHAVTAPEHRKLRLAVSKAAEGSDGAAITWVTLYGHQAAIVPAGMAEYALRHGWGR